MRLQLHLAITTVILPLLAIGAFAGDDDMMLKGQAAYGDWTKDAPGVKRVLTTQDLLPAHLTPASSNGPKIVPMPYDAKLNVPAGFKVTAFLTGFRDPRQLKVAPNGDIFLAESGATRIRVIRAPSDSDKASGASIFADDLPERPYGIAFYPPGNDPHYVYVATEGHVLRYPYRAGDLQASGPAEVIVRDLPLGHHWTRDVIFSPDGSKMYVSVGSGSNVAEEGMDAEKDRADILEYNPDGSGKRVFASGLRNPVTMAFNPTTHELWTTVNERDGLGDDVPPDYATHVVDKGFYGWPWFYIGSHQDSKHKGQHPELNGHVLTPDILLQPHSAPLGCDFYTGVQYPGAYRGDLFIALHGSWNRAQRTGYKIVHARFSNGKPTGEYDDFLTGFVTKDGSVWGRPVGLAMAKDGSVLVSDDASGTLWKIRYVGGQ